MSPGQKSVEGVWRDTLRDHDAWRNPNHATVALMAVGFTLSTYSRRGRAFPGRATIAKGAKVSVRTTDRSLSRLEAEGFLIIERTLGGKRQTNTYYLTIPDAAPSVRRSEWETATRHGPNGDIGGTKRRHQRHRKAVESYESAAPHAAGAFEGAAAGALIEDWCGACGERLPLVDDIYCKVCDARRQADDLIDAVRQALQAVEDGAGPVTGSWSGQKR
jgi:hypothetical protein